MRKSWAVVLLAASVFAASTRLACTCDVPVVLPVAQEPPHWERQERELPPWEDDLYRVRTDPDDDEAAMVAAQCSIDVLNHVGLEITAASVVVLGYWSDMAYGGPCEHWEVLRGLAE